MSELANSIDRAPTPRDPGGSAEPTPRPIDLDTWPRRQHFVHYLESSPCTYSMTVELDVTDFAAVMRASTRKTYLAQLWAIAAVVNRHEEFRMCLTESGQPAVWDEIDPSFTVFNKERETFSCVWAPYDPDFGIFHAAAAPILAEYSAATELFPQGDEPSNIFFLSSLPWVSFTGFNLNHQNAWRNLAPIFTIGRYVEREGRTLMPLAIQVHHAAADGFHVSRLVNELQELLTSPEWVGGH